MPMGKRGARGLVIVGLIALLVGGMGMGMPWTTKLRPSPLPAVPQAPAELAHWIDARERALPLRDDTAARIVWADPRHPRKTACSIVYLHGFTASQGEGEPLHRRLAQTFGCNLYLSRWPGHGLRNDDALRGVTAQGLLDAAAEAVAIGHAIGDRVILVGTSMGGALATQMTAQHAADADILATVLWSPLVSARNVSAQKLLAMPLGETLVKYRLNHGNDLIRGAVVDSPYWAQAGHLDGYVAAARLARGMTPQTFAQVRVPLFLGYFYRDGSHQDQTVSVAAMQSMLRQIGTPKAQVWSRNYPDAGDHVIASPLRSKASAEVFASTCRFLEQVAGLPPLHPHAQECAPAAALAETAD